MSKFSIIIPVYNVAPYLRECLDSVLSQTFTDWEAICVDDGSTDGSSAILDEYATRDRRFRVVHQDNQGVVAARVNGFNQSKGEMILFIDGDDEIVNNALEIISVECEDYSIDILEYGYEMRMINGGVELKRPSVIGSYSITQLLKMTLKTPLELIGMCIGDKCYKRNIVKKAFDEVSNIRISHSEDGLFAFAALLNSKKMHFIKDSLYVYKLREGSAVTRVNRNIVKEKILFVNKLYELSNKCGLFNQGQISKMMNFHKYQSCCYIFLMLARNGGVFKDYKILLSELRSTDFMGKQNSEWRGLKRRFLKFLILQPALCWFFHFLGFNKK